MESAGLGRSANIQRVPWFQDRQITEHLPPAFRLFAAYARVVGDPVTGAIKGSTALHRWLSALTRRFGWTDVALVGADTRKCAVDLLDLRMIQAFAEIQHVSREVEVLRGSLAPGGTFLDIGANHGTFALHLAGAVGRSGQVLAFEPQPRLAGLIRQSFDVNQMSQGTVIEAACGEREGTLELHVPVEASGSASLHREFLGRRAFSTVAVRVVTLDGVMAGHPVAGPVAIKLDVEGAEVAVLRGGREFLRAHRPPMLVELHPDSLRAAGETGPSLLQAMADAGYSRFAEVDQWPTARPLSELQIAPQRNVMIG